MVYFAEVLGSQKVWLVNENRRLVSIHESIEDAEEECRNHYHAEMKILDRRVRFQNRLPEGQQPKL